MLSNGIETLLSVLSKSDLCPNLFHPDFKYPYFYGFQRFHLFINFVPTYSKTIWYYNEINLNNYKILKSHVIYQNIVYCLGGVFISL